MLAHPPSQQSGSDVRLPTAQLPDLLRVHDPADCGISVVVSVVPGSEDRLRCLTGDGIAEFALYLQQLNARGDQPPPRALLTDDSFSTAFGLGDVVLEPRGFESRREFAEYIDGCFRKAGLHVEVDEPGMWEWLSLYYFDAVCPVVKGLRKPGVAGRHLLTDANLRRRHRHLLRAPYLLLRRYEGGSNGELDLLLGYRLPVHGIAATHLGERARLMTSRGALVAASWLYYDRVAEKPKVGYSDDHNGLRAYCKFIRNLPDCFDVSALSAESVIALLPTKFEEWVEDSGSGPSMRGTQSVFGPLAKIDMSDRQAIAGQLDHLLQGVEDRKITPSQTRIRSDLFRTAVMDAYDSRCAISRLGLRHARAEAPRYEVEAAHIIPVARGGRDRVENGLALSRSIHWAFDEGMLWIDDAYRVSMPDGFEHDARNRWLRQFQGRPLTLPATFEQRPSQDALRWHARNVAGQDV